MYPLNFVGHYDPAVEDAGLVDAARNWRACAPGEFAILSHDCTDANNINDDGDSFSTYKVRRLQGLLLLWALRKIAPSPDLCESDA